MPHQTPLPNTGPTPSRRPARGGKRRSSRNSAKFRIADVRPSERWYVAGASISLAGIVGSHVMLETARDALFLANLPPQRLALVYMGMAVLGFLVGRYDESVSRIFGRTNALVLTLMVAAIGTMLFYMAERNPGMTYALYLWTGLVGTILTLQFWLFMAARFTSAQGRRLYGLIAAGGVVGAVGGGLLGAIFTRYLSVDSLLPTAAALHLLTAILVTLAPEPSTFVGGQKPPPLREAIRTMVENSYLVRLGLMTALATITLLFTDYLFKSVTAARVPAGDLGPFLATYYMTLNAIALVVQVFIAMRILQRAGTILSLTLLPVFLMLGGGATAVFGGVLALVLITKGADGALRHSLHRVSNELLFLPLSPGERSRSKSFFDTMVNRGAQGMGALGILVLSRVEAANPHVLGAVVLGGAAIWTGLALSLRGPYLDQFRRSLTRPAEHGLHVSQLSLDALEVVLEALSSPDENRVLAAMGVLEEARRTGLIPALVLYHPSPAVLQRALAVIPSHERQDWVPLAQRLVEHEDPEVRLAAARALGRYGGLDQFDPQRISDPALGATIAFFQADSRAAPETHSKIASLLEPGADPAARDALLRAIADYGSRHWSEVILELERQGSPSGTRLLAEAMEKAKDPRFLPVLLHRLAFRHGRDQVRKALVAQGDEGLQCLEEALRDPQTAPPVLLHIPRAIARFENERAAETLLDIMENDFPGTVRYKALRGLGRLMDNTKLRVPASRVLPMVGENALECLRAGLMDARLREQLEDAPKSAEPSGRLLASLLQDKQRQSMERITRLLALLHPNEDLRSVYYALSGEDQSAKAAAGELIEVLTLGYDEELRARLRAISDPLPFADRASQLRELVALPIDSEVDALRELLADPDPPLSALAAEYASQREILELAVEVQEVLENNPWLEPFSHEPSRPEATT